MPRERQSVKERALELRALGYSNSAIGIQLGVGYEKVTAWIGKTPPENSRRRSKDYDLGYHSRAMYLRECGYSVREIAEQLGVPRSTVGDWIRGYGCYGRNNG